MRNALKSTLELTLFDFGVRYRNLGDDLYFCTLPNGLTFDLWCNDHGTIRLWRFIDVDPLKKAGTRYIYSKANAALGVEITDEGDIKLFTELQYAPHAPDFVQRINKMLAGYIDMITQYESRKLTVG